MRCLMSRTIQVLFMSTNWRENHIISKYGGVIYSQSVIVILKLLFFGNLLFIGSIHSLSSRIKESAW